EPGQLLGGLAHLDGGAPDYGGELGGVNGCLDSEIGVSSGDFGGGIDQIAVGHGEYVDDPAILVGGGDLLQVVAEAEDGGFGALVELAFEHGSDAEDLAGWARGLALGGCGAGSLEEGVTQGRQEVLEQGDGLVAGDIAGGDGDVSIKGVTLDEDELKGAAEI